MSYRPDARYINFLNWTMPLDTNEIVGLNIMFLEILIQQRIRHPESPWIPIDGDSDYKIRVSRSLAAKGLARISPDSKGGYVVESIIF